MSVQEESDITNVPVESDESDIDLTPAVAAADPLDNNGSNVDPFDALVNNPTIINNLYDDKVDSGSEQKDTSDSIPSTSKMVKKSGLSDEILSLFSREPKITAILSTEELEELKETGTLKEDNVSDAAGTTPRKRKRNAAKGWVEYTLTDSEEEGGDGETARKKQPPKKGKKRNSVDEKKAVKTKTPAKRKTKANEESDAEPPEKKAAKDEKIAKRGQKMNVQVKIKMDKKSDTESEAEVPEVKPKKKIGPKSKMKERVSDEELATKSYPSKLTQVVKKDYPPKRKMGPKSKTMPAVEEKVGHSKEDSVEKSRLKDSDDSDCSNILIKKKVTFKDKLKEDSVSSTSKATAKRGKACKKAKIDLSDTGPSSSEDDEEKQKKRELEEKMHRYAEMANVEVDWDTLFNGCPEIERWGRFKDFMTKKGLKGPITEKNVKALRLSLEKAAAKQSSLNSSVTNGSRMNGRASASSSWDEFEDRSAKLLNLMKEKKFSRVKIAKAEETLAEVRQERLKKRDLLVASIIKDVKEAEKPVDVFKEFADFLNNE